jgi:response regulator NasT
LTRFWTGTFQIHFNNSYITGIGRSAARNVTFPDCNGERRSARAPIRQPHLPGAPPEAAQAQTVRPDNLLARTQIRLMLHCSTKGTLLAPDDPDAGRNLTVRILLADDNAARAGALTKVLAADPSLTVLRPSPGQLLSDAVTALAPDVVLVDMARPDRDALEGIRVVSSNAPRPIVLFVDQDDPAFMEEAISAGVSSYNVLGVPPPDVKPILRAAAAMFRHHQSARSDLKRAESRLRERETVDLAKAILIKDRRMAEPDAYRWLRNRAMASGRRIRDIAQEIVAAKGGEPGGGDSRGEENEGIAARGSASPAKEEEAR